MYGGTYNMSEIIYLKDILLARLAKKPKKQVKRPRLKPFKYEKMQAFLVEKHKKEEKK